ncbi:MAG: hypothetical protein UV61_C0010G0024 [Candidatus Gottesmanbacteria bacterium GW2011_GWB1_43_11]|uniref:Uncharacterized protein n=1 Tax=Candidatus Gottesmanbacteria bacterium GW2011_GWB1_43_11 TaxID=1618446 RepID=A0A0G1FHY9_9BACT|nr:MAG: hypothetical protein UV04_C0012G0024 [Candidatus Gottesmanbacteria bacterium GW2011_GWA2_42_16]KKS53540.1 MAG: hypothetical protein UV17_C0035G0025 [Candidatus Gottesmanbacteria bacterium GW2011_GWA1_42_26]KKS81214.1 MAG: hypothetical protein UV55_C0018G0024 [Candidatus Gottesmanbacteria bacterium GW2011_GWC1_43_10]KKS86473.1 MAG: hypothetical protein UV61_C0010G0024 [Candidatus Gottesmanbacteria bacterium GW2011_GWB1_43_11]HCM37455.1 hypothetical protein [Patescibacteria group bacteriu
MTGLLVATAGITNPVLPTLGQGPGLPIVGNIVSGLIGIFMLIGLIMAFFHLIFGAIRWITASGDKTQLQNAQERMTQAIVGLILLAAVWAIVVMASNFLGFQQDAGVKSPIKFILPQLGQPKSTTP